MLPQEYMFTQIGASAYRNHSIDWAAHMLNNFDFIDPIQASTNETEWNSYADLWDDYEYIQTFTNTGTNGWYSPSDSLTTAAWSFNNYKLSNSLTESYTFEINGDATGTNGDASYFQGQVVVLNSTSGASFHNLHDIKSSCIIDLKLDAQ